ncbi:MAG TPA: hypothetical protein VN881_11235 [Candidatus Acidoferrales bacterium]|jgi:hypothetical protein|nr:hypothetical protein [Candidatus Acidoferrales bacterium]
MFERLKRALVESYVGAIAMGWLLATAVLDFVGIFSSPVQFWVSANDYQLLSHSGAGPIGFHLQGALPELIKTILVLLLWFILFRWLYLRPAKITPSEQANP